MRAFNRLSTIDDSKVVKSKRIISTTFNFFAYFRGTIRRVRRIFNIFGDGQWIIKRRTSNRAVTLGVERNDVFADVLPEVETLRGCCRLN
jgi:hypothetical protein